MPLFLASPSGGGVREVSLHGSPDRIERERGTLMFEDESPPKVQLMPVPKNKLFRVVADQRFIAE